LLSIGSSTGLCPTDVGEGHGGGGRWEEGDKGPGASVGGGGGQAVQVQVREGDVQVVCELEALTDLVSFWGGADALGRCLWFGGGLGC
jgi:hypothetical protein